MNQQTLYIVEGSDDNDMPMKSVYRYRLTPSVRIEFVDYFAIFLVVAIHIFPLAARLSDLRPVAFRPTFTV